MKVGDTVPVTIAGHVVTQARVTELGQGTATLRFDGQQVVMGVRTEFDLPNQDTAPVESEHQVLGVENDGVPSDPAPVGSNDGPAQSGQDNNVEDSEGTTGGNGLPDGSNVTDTGNVQPVDGNGGTSEDTA